MADAASSALTNVPRADHDDPAMRVETDISIAVAKSLGPINGTLSADLSWSAIGSPDVEMRAIVPLS